MLTQQIAETEQTRLNAMSSKDLMKLKSKTGRMIDRIPVPYYAGPARVRHAMTKIDNGMKIINAIDDILERRSA